MRKLILGISILVMAIIAVPLTSAHASLISGTTLFSSGAAPAWTASVAWEVFAPGDTASYLGGGSGIPEYSYFYLVTNTTGGSIPGLTTFTVGNPYGVSIVAAGWIDTAGETPNTAVINPSSTVYTFAFGSGDGLIDPGNTSDRLWIKSNHPPAMVNGGLIDGGNTDTQPIPGPVPEPSSVLLLGMGILGIFGLKRKVKA